MCIRDSVKRFIRRLDGTGIEVWLDTMVLEISAGREVTCVSAQRGLVTIQAGAVVLAMGCRERPRGALGIPEMCIRDSAYPLSFL